jgi:hypothetical protein
MWNAPKKAWNPLKRKTEPLTPRAAEAQTAGPQSFDLHPEIPEAERRIFRITDDDLGIGTPSERYANNVAAIRLLKKAGSGEPLCHIGGTGRPLKVCGWGGLADCFDEKHSKYGELKPCSPRTSTRRRGNPPDGLLHPARGYPFYDQALENMNFNAGNVLEPSSASATSSECSRRAWNQSKLYGVKLDSISGRIAQQLYQKSSVAVQGYEKTDLPDTSLTPLSAMSRSGSFKVPDKRYDKNNFSSFTTISLPAPWIRYDRAALWPLSPARARWTRRTRRPQVYRSARRHAGRDTSSEQHLQERGRNGSHQRHPLPPKA